MKQKINVHFQNGLTLAGFKQEVFDVEHLDELYEFEESANPDFVVFGPYGNDIPPKGNYTRIGYFCENIKPDFSICDWAFGIPREEDVNRPNYKRIQWHGIDPQVLVKPVGYDPEKILPSKTKFCNFLYSHKVNYRENFFSRLSNYKKVDAPGKRMNNMPGIDAQYQGSKWEIKRQFLSPYKFTIAFENNIFPGYQTEKLYDAMMADSIPIYCGDPYIGDIFNTQSFINAADYMPQNQNGLIKKMEKAGQMDFEDIRPTFLNSPKHRAKRKLKSLVRGLRAGLQFSGMDFTAVIDKIIELDNNPDLYLQYLQQPWFNNNTVPQNSSAKNRWIEIFSSPK